jgi:GH24 family phage-related lysozyme (muramidase)
VWTIGVGQTKSDDIDPKTMGKLTLQQAVDLFKRKIKGYTKAVDALGLHLTQYQYDALTSLCYNFGEGNLRKLCHGRTLEEIGDAIMLYTKPPEITERRRKEQRLFKTGQYSNTDGKVLVFPVVNSHPHYKSGYQVDVRPYFVGGVVALAQPPKKPISTATKTGTGAVVAGTAGTIAVGIHQGWGVTPWLVAGGLAIGFALVMYLFHKADK